MVLVLESMQKFLKVSGEYTRKIGHLVLGFLLIQIPSLFEGLIIPLTLCLLISIIIFVASISNNLSSADKVERKSHGTYLYPLGVFFAYLIGFLLNRMDLFYPSVLILIFSDSIAAFAGQYAAKKRWELGGRILKKIRKTKLGTFMFFCTTFLVLLIYYSGILSFRTIMIFSLVSILVTIVEFFSSRGVDNVTIPVLSILILFVLF